MAVFRVEKNRNYTVMSNVHLKDRGISLKAKGLLSVILSLPEDWNYTTRGLAAICKEGVDSIGAALRELESAGYLARHRLRDRSGRISDTEYVVYESPHKETEADLPDKVSQVLPDISHLRVLLVQAQEDVLDVMIAQLFESALDHLSGVILPCDLDIRLAAAQRFRHDLHDLIQTFMVVRRVQRIVFDLLLDLSKCSPVLPCIHLIHIAHARIGLLCPLFLDHDWIRI